jgi:transposase InsO family protein
VWLAGVSRVGYYRFLADQYPKEEDIEVRDAIQQIAIQHKRRYGYRRITRELHDSRKMIVNHKRVLGIMRDDNLLALRGRHRKTTTNSVHQLEVYLNLAARMKPTAINQLWVADITYVRLRHQFVYLAVVIDAWSRKVVGWALEHTLSARLSIAALQHALQTRQPLPGLVHHSDRGIQYACGDYVALLQTHQLTPSMSRPGNPYDNAFAESFMNTLKREEIYCVKYQDLEDLRQHLEEFLEEYYNKLRLHSALGYKTPEQFEREAVTQEPGLLNAPKMSFFRHEKSTAPIFLL